MRLSQNVNMADAKTGRNTNGTASVSEMPGRGKIDAELMLKIIVAQDRRALQNIAAHYAPRLKAYMMRRGEAPQTAEDIVQDVIILVWTKASQFDPKRGSFSAWIYRMTRNRWIDHKRKQGPMQSTAPEIMATLSDDFVDAADKIFDKAEATYAVRKKMAALPRAQKQMLQMSFFEGLSHTQIADRTGLPLGTVKGRMRASLKAMRPGLENFRGVDK